MSRRFPLLFVGLLLLCARASAFNVYHLGGTDGNPWQRAVSFCFLALCSSAFFWLG